MRAWWCLLLAVSVASCGVQEHKRATSASPPLRLPDAGGGGPTIDAPANTIDGPGDVAALDGSSGIVPAAIDGPSIAADRHAVDEPPLSGMVVDINGLQVPKEHVIAFIHFGHSNMAGRALGPLELRPYFFESSPRAWMYHTDKGWEPAVEPGTAGDVGNSPGYMGLVYGGPGTALVKEAAEITRSDYHFVSLGFGRSAANCPEFLPGALYYDAMMQVPLALKGKVTFGGIFVMLGINDDHGTPTDPNTGYAACIDKVITAIRTDLGEPSLPLLLTDWEMEATGAFAPTSPSGQTIIGQIKLIPGRVSNSAIVPTDKLDMQDDHHFRFPGHYEWDRRALDIMQQRGWFPWPAPQ